MGKTISTTPRSVFDGHEIQGFYRSMINCGIEIFKENLSPNFALIAVFVKVAFKITKRAQHCVLP